MITTQISIFAFYAARAILLLLVFLSFFTVAFFIERMIFFSKNFFKEGESILHAIDKARSVDKIRTLLEDSQTAEASVILKGLVQDPDSNNEFTKKVSAYLYLEKEKWERFLLFLGTVGSNAPFIGLLGTVFGILKSFADLGASTTGGGPQVVMAGISEALIVTAAGLSVAIPAVIFFNICKVYVKKSVSRVEAIVELINSKDIF